MSLANLVKTKLTSLAARALKVRPVRLAGLPMREALPVVLGALARRIPDT